MSTLFGITLIETPYAVQIKVEWRVERASTKLKRRRNWTVRRVETKVPCAFILSGQIFAHPEVAGELKRQGPTDVVRIDNAIARYMEGGV